MILFLDCGQKHKRLIGSTGSFDDLATALQGADEMDDMLSPIHVSISGFFIRHKWIIE